AFRFTVHARHGMPPQEPEHRQCSCGEQRAPATKKGRCRLHGGASGSGGPPRERNGQYRHGERTKAIAEQRKFSAVLKMLRAGLTWIRKIRGLRRHEPLFWPP